MIWIPSSQNHLLYCIRYPSSYPSINPPEIISHHLFMGWYHSKHILYTYLWIIHVTNANDYSLYTIIHKIPFAISHCNSIYYYIYIYIHASYTITISWIYIYNVQYIYIDTYLHYYHTIISWYAIYQHTCILYIYIYICTHTHISLFIYMIPKNIIHLCRSDNIPWYSIYFHLFP